MARALVRNAEGILPRRPLSPAINTGPRFLQSAAVRFAPQNRFLTMLPMRRKLVAIAHPSDTTLGNTLLAHESINPNGPRGIITCDPRHGCNFTPLAPISVTASPSTTNPGNCPSGETWDGTECTAGTTTPTSSTDALTAALAAALLGGGSPGTGAGAGQGIYVPPTQPGTSSSTGNPVLIILVLAVIGGLAYWLWRRSKKKQAPPA